MPFTFPPFLTRCRMVNYFINSIPLLRFEVHFVMLLSLITKVRFGGDEFRAYECRHVTVWHRDPSLIVAYFFPVNSIRALEQGPASPRKELSKHQEVSSGCTEQQCARKMVSQARGR